MHMSSFQAELCAAGLHGMLMGKDTHVHLHGMAVSDAL